MVGAELRFPELERLLEERQGQVQLRRPSRYAAARLFMLTSVSGWSGPSLAFVSLSVSSKSGRARSSFPACLIRPGEVVHAGERVGMVGAELGFHELERLLEERQGQVQLPGILIRHGEVVHAS